MQPFKKQGPCDPTLHIGPPHYGQSGLVHIVLLECTRVLKLVNNLQLNFNITTCVASPLASVSELVASPCLSTLLMPLLSLNISSHSLLALNLPPSPLKEVVDITMDLSGFLAYDQLTYNIPCKMLLVQPH